MLGNKCNNPLRPIYLNRTILRQRGKFRNPTHAYDIGIFHHLHIFHNFDGHLSFSREDSPQSFSWTDVFIWEALDRIRTCNHPLTMRDSGYDTSLTCPLSYEGPKSKSSHTILVLDFCRLLFHWDGEHIHRDHLEIWRPTYIHNACQPCDLGSPLYMSSFLLRLCKVDVLFQSLSWLLSLSSWYSLIKPPLLVLLETERRVWHVSLPMSTILKFQRNKWLWTPDKQDMKFSFPFRFRIPILFYFGTFFQKIKHF